MIEILTIPGVILIIGAVLLSLLPQKIRSSAFLIFPIAALAFVLTRPDGYSVTASLGNFELIVMEVDALSRVFGIIFAITAFVAGTYAWHIKDLGQQINALVYAGSALGVTYAGDLLSLIIFWELMAVSSTWLIWANRTEASDKAGTRYLLYHILGGGLLLAGIIWHYMTTGSLMVESLEQNYTIANVLMLVGVAINAAVIPLHTWLADAYPKATITGAVFMSAFTTKSAVYVLIRVFPGWELLIWFGAAMAIYGVVYAVICKDIREILAYHIISQVGFMVCGIGIGTDMALNGATAHAYSHILYKSLLFMSTGAVLYATGTSKLVHLGGLAKKMPYVLGLYLVGGFSISGLPLFNGYISKSMTISAAGYAHNEMAMLMLLFASVGTFLSVGLKLPYYTWFGKEDNDIDVKPIPKNMYIGMGIAAFACIFYGLYPQALYMYLPFEYDYNPFTVYHFVEITQISLMTFAGFWLLRKKLAGELIIALDVDWFYRKAAPLTRKVFVNGVDNFYDRVEDKIWDIARFLTQKFKNPMTWLNPFTDRNNEATRYSPAMEVVMSLILFTVLVFSLLYLI
ncbi:Na(+)/H(+) antiporter subunit D [Rhodohalobacter halophilus]|uniref:Na(+)/H(+) antiporter subunit D n=1 Tax=Rhodohalobacter halophilus TaxID=1812810 RepID=UPI00083FA0FC|nr:Na(+)/H(+) antiporter subunit D [Rhodohalobacter halophilus]